MAPTGKGAVTLPTGGRRTPVRRVLAVVDGDGARHVADAGDLLGRDPRIAVRYATPDDADAALRVGADLVVTSDGTLLGGSGGPAAWLPGGVSCRMPEPAWCPRGGAYLVGLAHARHARPLAEHCPHATVVAGVTGDLCLDRLVASMQGRQRYRRALGVTEDRILVAVSAPCGLLRDGYSVTWRAGGDRPSPADWRDVVAAADVVVGTVGPATVYAAAAGVPVLRVVHPWRERPGTLAPLAEAAARLVASTPAWSPGESLVPRLLAAIGEYGERARAEVADAVTSRPGRAARLLRCHLYRLLDLREPTNAPRPAPVPVFSGFPVLFRTDVFVGIAIPPYTGPAAGGCMAPE